MLATPTTGQQVIWKEMRKIYQRIIRVKIIKKVYAHEGCILKIEEAMCNSKKYSLLVNIAL